MGITPIIYDIPRSLFLPGIRLWRVFLSGLDNMNRQDERQVERQAVPLRDWYVRLENIHVPTSLRGYRRITTTVDSELLSTVMSTYAFDERIRSRLQLWSSPFRVRPYARRLDGLDVIPTEYLFVYVRMV